MLYSADKMDQKIFSFPQALWNSASSFVLLPSRCFLYSKISLFIY